MFLYLRAVIVVIGGATSDSSNLYCTFCQGSFLIASCLRRGRLEETSDAASRRTLGVG